MITSLDKEAVSLTYTKLNRGQGFKLTYSYWIRNLIRKTISVEKPVYLFFIFVSYARQSVGENAG